jgi:hypothetical protein
MSDDDNSVPPPSGVSRRQALKVLGAVPMAAALNQQPYRPAVSSQVPTKAVVGVAEGPKFFNAHEWKTLRTLVDYIIPRDETSGSATDAKVPEYIDFLLAERDANVNEQVAMHGGLAWIDTESHKRFGETFIEATDAQRRAILDDIAYPAKAKPELSNGVAFFTHVRDRTASGFYSSAMGWKDVRYKGNVFNPGYDGCPPEALAKLGVSYDVMQSRISPQEK